MFICSFQEYMIIMRDQDTLNTMQTHLNRWVPNPAIRVVGAALLIKHFRNDVLKNEHGDLEQQLFQATNNFVSRWEAGCNGEEVPDLLELYNEFMRVFQIWKSRDEVVQISRIRHTLRALMEVRAQAPKPEQFDEQINRLRNKIRLIGGDEALANFDNGQPMAAPDPRPINIKEVVSANFPDTRPSNLQMAYELLLDEKYQLVNNPNEVLKPFEDGFWNSVVDELQFETPIFVRALYAANKIIDHINMLRRSVVMPRVEVLDWPECQRLGNKMYEHLLDLAQPERRREFVREWPGFDAEYNAEALARNLRMLLNYVDKIRIDEANLR